MDNGLDVPGGSGQGVQRDRSRRPDTHPGVRLRRQHSAARAASTQRERGVLTSLEHDPHWATLIQDHLQLEHLDQIARVVHAPLEGDPPWYRLDEMPDEIDLLIVDGPPAFESGHGAARAPALARLDDKLVHDAAVILDDIERPGEQQIIATWETSTSWRFQLNLPAGVAIGQRQTEPPSP